MYIPIIRWFRVNLQEREVKVNIFDMAGHPVFYEVSVVQIA